MNLIAINNLTKTYNGTIIIDSINFSLNKGDKLAIVGRNGAGKSTLAKIICKEEDFDSGNIFISTNIKIGYFSQHSFIESNDTVYNEMLKLFSKQIELKQVLDNLAVELLNNTDEKLLAKYNFLLHEFEEIGGYNYLYQVETMLNRFGFNDYYHHLVNQLSGGQKTRLALARLLLSEPDILILDEPTNHLDLATVEFLENFLKNYKKTVVIISHDRYFLNQVVNQVYEIEFNKGISYIGNYDAFLIQKEAKYEQMLKDYNLQQKLIEKERNFIEKNIVRASTTKRAQSRRKKLEKMAILDDPRIDSKNIKLNFDFKQKSGNIVLEVNNLSVGYNEELINNISFLLLKNEKVAIIGPNGIGKSTLLKTINQKVQPLKGEIKYGTGINIAYFDQELAVLNSSKTVLDEIWDENRLMIEKEIRTVLGSFLFTDDDVFKIVSQLSGGEKVRLALAKLMLKKANFLILDEVTNHLDILSREVLEDALIDFPGTILFVSHDRFFINSVATKIIELSNNNALVYDGDYNYYLEKRTHNDNKKQTKVKENNEFLQNKKLKSEQQKIKRQIESLEKEISNLEDKLNQLKIEQLKEEVYRDYEKAKAVSDLIDKTEITLNETIDKWSQIIEKLEE